MGNDFEPKTIIFGIKEKQSNGKENKKKNKNRGNYGNGHFWPNHHDAHFEHQCQNFSKLNPLNSLHGLQDHIKMITLMLAKIAERFSNAHIKNSKWQSSNRNKITPKIEFHQTFSTLQTKAT